MTGFKPGTSGVKSNCSTHCATTTAQKELFYALTAKPFCRSNIAQQLQNIFQLFSEEDPEEPTGPRGHQIQTTTTQEPSQVCKNLNSKKLDCLLPQRATK